MSRERSVKIGVFVAGAAALLVAALLMFADLRVWRDRTSYWTRFPYSVSGLIVGAPVEVWGVRVGSIESIDLDDEGVRVGVVIDTDVQVPRDARASLKIEGLTGVKYMDIQDGDLSGPALQPGQEIAASERDLGQALEGAMAAIERLDGMAAKADELLAASTAVADNLRALTNDETRQRLAALLTSAEETSSEARGAAGELLKLARTANQRVPALLASLRRAGQNTEKLSEQGLSISEDIGSAAAEARRAASALATLAESTKGDIFDVLAQIREAAMTAESVLRAIESNPGRLLRSRPRREIPPP